MQKTKLTAHRGMQRKQRTVAEIYKQPHLFGIECSIRPYAGFALDQSLQKGVGDSKNPGILDMQSF